MVAERSPEEVFQHHGEALGAEDVDAIASDYAEDAVLITPAGAVRGRADIRGVFAGLLADLPRATWDIRTTIFEDDVLLLEWGADSDANRIEDGVDTFVFRDGLIRVQTARFTLTPKA